MTIRFDAIGMIVSDMASALAFYRMLGLDIAAAAYTEGHAEAMLPGGARLMWDTVDTVQSFSEWEPPSGGHRVSLAFLCDDPAAVNTKYAEMVAAGYLSHVAPFDAIWGQRYATVLGDWCESPVLARCRRRNPTIVGGASRHGYFHTTLLDPDGNPVDLFAALIDS